MRALPYAVLAGVQLGAALVFLLDAAPGTRAALDGLPLDDAWIHLVYARSLAALEGFAYNPGALETGFTSPLWVVSLAPLHWLAPLWGGGVVYGVKALGIVLAWANSALGYRLARDLAGPVAGWLAGLLIALDPALGFARVSGMEVLLASGLVLGSLVLLVRERPAGAGLLAGLAPLARPESALFTLLVAPVIAWRLVRRRAGAGAWLFAFAPGVLAGLAWMLFCLQVSGRPLPATFYVKAAAGTALVPNLVAVATFLLDLPWFYLGSGGVLYAAAAVRLLRSSSDRVSCGLVVSYPVVFLLAISNTHVLLQPLDFYWSRYLQPALPLIHVTLAVGLVAIGGRAHDVLTRRDASPPRAVLAGLGAFVCILSLVSLPASLLRSADRYAWNAQNVNEMQVAMAHWLRANAAPGEWVASVDAGAIRYHSGLPVLDLLGLNSLAVLEQGMVGALASERPRYVVVFPEVFRRLGDDAGFRKLHSVRAENYTICPACPQDELVVYEWVGRGTPRLSGREGVE